MMGDTAKMAILSRGAPGIIQSSQCESDDAHRKQAQILIAYLSAKEKDSMV
jgi:hypothetical protein